MPTFAFTYQSPQDYQAGTPEGTAAWAAWFQSIGADLLDIGRPVGESTAVGGCGSDIGPLGGCSLIRADDLAAARTAATGCPFVDAGGGAEAGLLVDLPGTPSDS